VFVENAQGATVDCAGCDGTECPQAGGGKPINDPESSQAVEIFEATPSGVVVLRQLRYMKDNSPW
jgi:hypothetical protein